MAVGGLEPCCGCWMGPAMARVPHSSSSNRRARGGVGEIKAFSDKAQKAVPAVVFLPQQEWWERPRARHLAVGTVRAGFIYTSQMALGVFIDSDLFLAFLWTWGWRYRCWHWLKELLFNFPLNRPLFL